MKPAAALVMLFLAPAVAAAHGLSVEATLAAGRVTIVAAYDTDEPAAAARVIVSRDGAEVTTGVTDDRGEYAFPAPPAGVYGIRVDDGQGHRARARLTIPEVPDADGGAVADGAGRTTGSGRWLRIGGGLGVVALLTIIGRRATRRAG